MHISGKAADIQILLGYGPRDIAIYAESVNKIKGIGLYCTFVHIDVRTNKYYWDNTSGDEIRVDTFKQTKPALAVPTLRAGMRGLQVYNLQKDLKYIGYAINPDGIFGQQTLDCVKRFQSDHCIAVDGIYGNITRAEIKKELDKE